MIPVILISAILLIESRDILNGFISQPFSVAVFMAVFWGFDPFPLLILAAAVHLIYIGRTPSGASLYPEYPFSFFISAAAFGPGRISFTEFFLLLSSIIILSNITAFALNKKRHFFEKHREKLVFYHRFPSLIPAFVFSYIFFAIYSTAIYLILKTVYFAFSSLASKYSVGEVISERYILFVPLVFSAVYLTKILKSKNA